MILILPLVAVLEVPLLAFLAWRPSRAASPPIAPTSAVSAFQRLAGKVDARIRAAAAKAGEPVDPIKVIDGLRVKASAKGRAQKAKNGAKPGSRLVGGANDLAASGVRKNQ